MRPLALVAFPLVMLCSVASGQSTPTGPDRCDIVPAGQPDLPPQLMSDCPDDQDDFLLIESAEGTELTWVGEDEPVAVRPNCTPTEGGGYCEAWPQEHTSMGKLGYIWQIQTSTSNERTSGTNPVTVFSCTAQEPVTATLTVVNGTYEATQSVTFACGTASE